MLNLKTQKTPVVMQIIPELGPGGAEQGCIDVAAALVQAGARALVVASGGARVGEIIRAKAEFIPMPVQSKNPWEMYCNIGRIRRLINAWNVDIVHVRSRAPAWSAWYACKGTGAKFMTTVHAPYNEGGKLKHFYNSIMMRGERVIAISGHVARYITENFRINPDKMRLIHRGIALERFHPTMVGMQRMATLLRDWRIEDGAPIVLLPGRITRWKGHHVLLQAMSQLGRPDVFCVLLGSDQGRTEYRQELEAQIGALGLTGQVRIIDHCSDMPAAYMISSVVVSASTDPEGFGRVPVEAQAMGRPIIATDHGGAQETILRGETGWLIPPNDVQAMAEALRQALALTPGQRAALATRSMAHVAGHFTREKMCAETLAVYAELLAEKYGQ
ncbi:MAG: glycosyltransferase family 4 protein [Rhodospirillales bacterium]|nr:glycosyltransferase family 4 protein [Alphaproteobacteria bacterium]MCB9986725.1 glycosyltransferase family 4 protein [Rhodospirillales bacterium]USO08505.1 MAG: glycosyltransferase family 4 protein [Rhodospirillales bacterium]